MEKKEQNKLSEILIDILEDAINRWWNDEQIDIDIKEIEKLIVDINLFQRNGIDKHSVIVNFQKL